MDEIKAQKAVSRAAQATALMQSELLQEAFKTMEADYIDFWKLTPVRDQDARERVWNAIQVIGKVKGHLQKVLDDGKLAKRDLDEFRKSRQPAA